MGVFRGTMEFQLYNFGWRESWYFNAGGIDAVRLRLDSILPKRLLALVPAATCQFYRIASVDLTPNISAVLPVAAGKGTWGTSPRDVSKVCLNMPVYSITGHKRVFQLHGVNDNSITFDPDTGAPEAMPSATTKYNNYMQAVHDAAGQIATRVRKFNDTNLPAVEDITVVGNNITFKVAGLGALAPGTRVEIRGGRGFHVRQFMGSWRVGSYTDPDLVVSSRRLIDPRFYYDKSSARVRLPGLGNYTYDAVDHWDTTQIVASTRKVGRPPEQPRGRQSGRS